jgi:branched-chain amino acid transport system permease protein
MRRARALPLLVPGLGVPLFLLVMPWVLSATDIFTATSGLVVALIILSLGVVTGRAGMLSLCQMAFAAVGAWVFLWLQVHDHSLPFLVDLVIGGLITVPVGLLIGLPALRLRGVNLAVITLAFAAALNVIITVNDFPGISQGVFVARPGFIQSDKAYFWFCAVVFCIAAGLIAALARTRIGASWLAVRHSERATAALGRSVTRTKMSAFGLSAFIAGIAGGLFVGQLGAVTIEAFAPLTSLTFFALAVMVGARYPEGALLGGALSAFIPVLLNKIGVAQDMGNLLFAFGATVGLIGGAGAAEAIRFGLRRKLLAPPQQPEVTLTGASGTGGARANGSASSTVGASSTVADATPALQINDMTVRFGQVTALDDVTLSVTAGAVVALIGPNGAGKSTLIDCVTGFIRPYDGTVLLGGEQIDRLAPHQRAHRGLRRSFQQDRTIPELSINQYVRLSLSRQRRAALSRADLVEMLRFFGCPAPEYRVGEVDVGTRRLLELVAAVAGRPTIALFDEPAAGLAHAESRVLAERIREIPERFGPSVLVVDHDMELVQAACSQITVLDFGKVIASGAPADVLADQSVVRAYLGEELAVA